MQRRIDHFFKVLSDSLSSVRIDLFSVAESHSHPIEILLRYHTITIEVMVMEIRSHLPRPKLRHLPTIMTDTAHDLSTENLQNLYDPREQLKY